MTAIDAARCEQCKGTGSVFKSGVPKMFWPFCSAAHVVLVDNDTHVWCDPDKVVWWCRAHNRTPKIGRFHYCEAWDSPLACRVTRALVIVYPEASA